MKPAKVPVACPHCGHVGLEAPTAYSTVCRQCQTYFRVQDVLKPATAARPSIIPTRRITCFGCGGGLEVATAAQSTICKHCARHIDLQDYRVTSAMPKTIQTKGRLVIEEGGFLFNTDSIAGHVVLKGRLLGKLVAEQSLELHSHGQIKGSFRTNLLVIPAGASVHWPEGLKVQAAEIVGELVADIVADEKVTLKANARFFGRLRARDLVVESGAILVGSTHVGP